MNEKDFMKLVVEKKLPDLSDVHDECISNISDKKTIKRRYMAAVIVFVLIISCTSVGYLIKINGNKDVSGDNRTEAVLGDNTTEEGTVDVPDGNISEERSTNVDFKTLPYYQSDSLHFEKNETITIKTQRDKSYEHVVIYNVGEGTQIEIDELSNGNNYVFKVERSGDYIILCEEDGGLVEISKELIIDISVKIDEDNDGDGNGVIPLK